MKPDNDFKGFTGQALSLSAGSTLFASRLDDTDVSLPAQAVSDGQEAMHTDLPMEHPRGMSSHIPHLNPR